jgi:hypothetical protein
MPKILLLIVAALGVPVSAMSQAKLSACTPPGYAVAQLMTLRRTGVGAYTLTALIKEDVVTRDGKKTTGGVTSSFQARDSQGRTRVDWPSICLMDKSGQSHWQGSVTVDDPVAGTRTTWRVSFLPTTLPMLNGPLPAKKPDPLPVEDEIRSALEASKFSEQDPEHEKHIQTKAEDLGNRMIVGLEARGIRITTTYPVGIIGNAQPITSVEERWLSEEFRIMLLDTIDSSLFGKSSYEVTKFTLGEPDPALFQAPAGN